MGSSHNFPGFLLRRCGNQLASPACEVSEEQTIYHRRTRRTELSDLPEDQIVDILLRLPIKSLLRAKVVSKAWYDLINSPNLVSKFNSNNKAKEVTVYCKPGSLSNLPSSDTSTNITIGFHDLTVELTVPLPVDFLRVVGCCDGLVCLSFSKRQENFAIWNPATRHFRLIPPVGAVHHSRRIYRLFSSGFCYDPTANAHKISRLEIFKADDDNSRRVQLHVFTLTSDSWMEKTLFIPFPFQTGFSDVPSAGPTCVGKHLFWTSDLSPNANGYRSPHDKYILRFDMLEEFFTRIELPCADPLWYCSMTRIASYKGTIAIFRLRRPPPFDIWVLNDCGGPNQSWSLQRICPPSSIKFYPIACFGKDGVDLLLVKSPSGHLIWDPRSGETLANLGITYQHGGYATYHESLTSVM